MRAVVFLAQGRMDVRDVPDPEITDESDVIVQVDSTTICRTGLHIPGGHVPSVRPGRSLGHEAVGTVDELGDAVHTIGLGDRVLLSCISACGMPVLPRRTLRRVPGGRRLAARAQLPRNAGRIRAGAIR
jgi:alcohol dehydrogenase